MKLFLHFQERQTGKSEYILKHSFKNDLIICCKLDSAKHMERKNKEFGEPDKYFTSYQAVEELFNKGVLHNITHIWLDEFDFFPLEAQNNLYRFLKINFDDKIVIGYSSHNTPLSDLIINASAITSAI